MSIVKFGKFRLCYYFGFVIVVISDDFFVNYLQKQAGGYLVKLYAILGILQGSIYGRGIHLFGGDAVIESELCLCGYLYDLADRVSDAIAGSFNGFIYSVGIKGYFRSVSFSNCYRHRVLL